MSMEQETTFRIATLSPVRTPISSNSEQRAAHALKEETGGLGIPPSESLLGASDTLKAFPWPWANGYGTLDHDNLPEFFQPFECYTVDTSACSDASESMAQLTKAWSGTVDCCQLYLYDDTIALLQLDISLPSNLPAIHQALLSGELDKTLSNLASDIYNLCLYPLFHEYCLNFRSRFGSRQQQNEHQLRDPNQLQVFKDVTFDRQHAPPSHVLWTGRYAAIAPSVLTTSLGEALHEWASFPGTREQLGEKGHYVGSGNILITGGSSAAVRDDWLRGLSLCQFYNAILFIYGSILKSSYSQLTDLLGARRTRNRELNRLMKDVTLSLDHLEFTRLEFNEARVGVQGERARIVEDTCAAWKLDNLIASALERTDLIRSRIARLLDARKSRVDKTVELILAGIGGVALVDLFISLTTAARDLREDDIPGLLDAFLWLPPDGSIGLSSLLLILVFAYIYLAKR